MEGLGRGDPGVVKLLINGEPRTIEGARTVAELIATLGLPAPAMLVEHNGTALHRDEWAARALGEEDRIEIVRIVAGG